MGDVGYIGWALAIFFYLLMAGSGWYAGIYTIQLYVHFGHRKSNASFRKWGVESELFRQRRLRGFVLSGVLVIVFLAFTFFSALFSAVLVTETSSFTLNQVLFTLYVLVWAFTLGYFREMTRTADILQKVWRLDNLKDTFRQRFTASEILSMHESLLSGPPIIWEEYANLPDEAIGYETNDKYRKLVEPYRHRQFIGHNKTMVALTIVALLIAAIGAMMTIWEASD